MSTTPTTLGPPSTTAQNTKLNCKHANTKRPFNDHTLVCADCGKDLTDTQTSGATPKPLSVSPKISSLSPSTGTAGNQAVINGSGFGANNDSGKSTVTVGGAAVATSSWSDSRITIDIPPHAAGSVDVVVKVNGQSSNASAFVYTA